MATSAAREIQLGNRTVQYTIRRSVRARRMSLRMLPGRGLEVVLPRGLTQRDAVAFIRREQEWVLRAVNRFPPECPTTLRSGSELPFLDERLSLLLTPGARPSARRTDTIVTVTTTDPELVQSTLESWYRQEARRELIDRARVHAATLGVELKRIAIKDTRSRWGSCSQLGNLNFSWRLMLAPSAVMDYVAAHEVAHLRELNHSPRFWQHVEHLCPHYRTHRLWLRTHGTSLSNWPNTAT